MKTRIEKTKAWVDGLEPAAGEFYILLRISGGKAKQAWVPNPQVIKNVLWSTFDDLLLAINNNELSDIATGIIATSINTRSLAAKLLRKFSSTRTFDAYGDEVSDLLDQFVSSSLITFNATDKTNLLTALQNN